MMKKKEDKWIGVIEKVLCCPLNTKRRNIILWTVFFPVMFPIFGLGAFIVCVLWLQLTTNLYIVAACLCQFFLCAIVMVVKVFIDSPYEIRRANSLNPEEPSKKVMRWSAYYDRESGDVVRDQPAVSVFTLKKPLGRRASVASPNGKVQRTTKDKDLDRVRKKMLYFVWSWTNVLLLLSLVLEFMQITSYAFHPEVHSLFFPEMKRVVGYSMVDFDSFFMEHRKEFFYGTLILGLLVMLFRGLVSCCCYRGSSSGFCKGKEASHYILIIANLVFLPVMRNILLPLACTYEGDSVTVATVDILPDTVCWSADHRMLVLLSLSGCILIFPGFVWVFVVSERMVGKHDVLFGRNYMALVAIMKLTLVAFSTLVSKTPVYQLTGTVVILTAGFSVLMHWSRCEPVCNHEPTFIFRMLLYALGVCAACASLLGYFQFNTSDGVIPIFCYATICVVTFVGFLVYVCFRHLIFLPKSKAQFSMKRKSSIVVQDDMPVRVDVPEGAKGTPQRPPGVGTNQLDALLTPPAIPRDVNEMSPMLSPPMSSVKSKRNQSRNRTPSRSRHLGKPDHVLWRRSPIRAALDESVLGENGTVRFELCMDD